MKNKGYTSLRVSFMITNLCISSTGYFIIGHCYGTGLHLEIENHGYSNSMSLAYGIS